MAVLNKKMKVKVPRVSVSSSHHHVSLLHMLVVVTAIATVGSFFVFKSSANAPVVASLEAEKMSQPTGSSIVNDSVASGGQALKMTVNGASSSSFSTPSKATTVTLKARASQCGGSPSVNMTIDGNAVMPTTAVATSSYSSFSKTIDLPAGSHKLNISGSGLGRLRINRHTCARVVYLDITTFYGPEPIAKPAPTISLSGSPTNIASGASSSLSWNATNATTCTAAGGWSGSKATSGSETVRPTASTQYSLTCSGDGGSSSTSAAINVSSTGSSSTSIYWGAWIDGDVYSTGSADAPWSTAGGSWDLFEKNAGKKISVLHYGQPPMWTQPFVPGVANNITNRGAIPFMDMSSQSVPLTDITAGKYDSSIITWAQAVKTWGKPFFFRWNWEMNGTWYSWGSQAQANPANYTAAWKHFHDVVAAQGANNVTWVWCPNTEYSGSTPLDQLYPGDSYVDWTCVDGYNFGTNPLKKDSWTSFGQRFQPTYSSLQRIAPSKPIIIGETASTELGGSKSAWISDALTTQIPKNFPQIKGVLWFNWNISENGGVWDWPIESSPSSQAAFASGIASPYYSTNTFGNLPLNTKVQPPK